MPTPWCPESGRIVAAVDDRTTCHRCGKRVRVVERRVGKHRIPARSRGAPSDVEAQDDGIARRAS